MVVLPQATTIAPLTVLKTQETEENGGNQKNGSRRNFHTQKEEETTGRSAWPTPTPSKVADFHAAVNTLWHTIITQPRRASEKHVPFGTMWIALSADRGVVCVLAGSEGVGILVCRHIDGVSANR
jgi:hypothetical protein